MQPMNEPVPLETRYRTLLILWSALFISIGMFFVFAAFVPPETEPVENRMLSLVFLAVGTLAVIASRVAKHKLMAQAVAKQDVALVHKSLIVAAALSEVAALLGLMDHMLTGNRYFYVLFIIAVIGTVLNFPRRDHLLAASYKKGLT